MQATKTDWEKIEFERDYLRRLAVIATPEALSLGHDYQKVYKYCQVRNNAKDILDNPRDKTAKKELLGLVRELNLVFF